MENSVPQQQVHGICTMSKKEKRKFRDSLVETTMRSVAYDETVPDDVRKNVEKNYVLYLILKH